MGNPSFPLFPCLPTSSSFSQAGPLGREQVRISGLQARVEFAQIQPRHRRAWAGLRSKQRRLEISLPPAGWSQLAVQGQDTTLRLYTHGPLPRPDGASLRRVITLVIQVSATSVQTHRHPAIAPITHLPDALKSVRTQSSWTPASLAQASPVSLMGPTAQLQLSPPERAALEKQGSVSSLKLFGGREQGKVKSETNLLYGKWTCLQKKVQSAGQP